MNNITQKAGDQYGIKAENLILNGGEKIINSGDTVLFTREKSLFNGDMILLKTGQGKHGLYVLVKKENQYFIQDNQIGKTLKKLSKCEIETAFKVSGIIKS